MTDNKSTQTEKLVAFREQIKNNNIHEYEILNQLQKNKEICYKYKLQEIISN